MRNLWKFILLFGLLFAVSGQDCRFFEDDDDDFEDIFDDDDDDLFDDDDDDLFD